MKKEYPNLIQKLSEKGKSMPELHTMIMNLKAWIKGIHWIMCLHKDSKNTLYELLIDLTEEIVLSL